MEQSSQTNNSTNESTYEITFKFSSMSEMNKFTREYDVWRDSLLRADKNKQRMADLEDRRALREKRRKQLERIEEEKKRKRIQFVFQNILNDVGLV